MQYGLNLDNLSRNQRKLFYFSYSGDVTTDELMSIVEAALDFPTLTWENADDRVIDRLPDARRADIEEKAPATVLLFEVGD